MSIEPNTVRAAADAVQWADVIAAVAILILSLEAGRRWRGWRPYLAGPISWAAHSVAFYLAVLLRGRRVARGDGDGAAGDAQRRRHHRGLGQRHEQDLQDRLRWLGL